MEARMLKDEKILDILKEDPQKGLLLLMEKYTALIWHVSSLYVKNPEDIKECVNDSFSEFYFQREKFVPGKASLPAYLTAIARNRAISLYRRELRERKWMAAASAEELHKEDPQIMTAELRADIEKAMEALKPNELQIIRMKYYDGMSVREIADSLGLPYETVKKRHQRSILKLGRSLMLVLAMLVVLSACAYGVLRYFDIIPPIGSWSWPWSWEEKEEPEEEPRENTGTEEVRPLRLHEPEEETADSVQNTGEGNNREEFEEYPIHMPETAWKPEAAESVSTVMEGYTVSPGYGINMDSKDPVYSLAEKESVENEEYTLLLEDVRYINHTFTATVKVILKNETVHDWEMAYRSINAELFTYQENNWTHKSGISRKIDEYTLIEIFRFDSVTFPNIEEGMKGLSILFNTGERIEFDMVPVEQEKVSDYPYQVGKLGGILAIPRLENGSLIIAVYPLDDEDEFQIVPAIVAEAGSSEIQESMTVTGEDGAVLTGKCIRYRPWGEETYFEWDFGKAEPGNYILDIPCVNLRAEVTEGFSMPVDLIDNSWEDNIYEIPKGSIWIKECTPLDEKPDNWPDYKWMITPSEEKIWRICLGYSSEDPLCPITGFYGFQCQMEIYPQEPADDPEEDFDYPQYDFSLVSNDLETQTLEYMLRADLKLTNPKNTNIHIGKIGDLNYSDYLNYRWKQSFEIPFTVEENN